MVLLGIILAALMVVGLTGAANPAMQGVFELDGNGMTTSGSTAADWNCLFGTPTFCPAAQPDAKTHVTDKTLDNTDNILGQGSKDILDISQWTGVSQSPPAKDDIANAAWANYSVPVAGDSTNPIHDIVYFAADRISANGNAYLGFWFFKSNISENSDGTFNGVHQPGDTLVLVNFLQGNGGNKISAGVQSIGVFKWVTSGGDVSTNLQTLVPITDGTCTGSAASVDACAQFNTDNQPSVWDFQSADSGDPANTWAPSEFAEGGIDLTALLGQQACFSTVMAETRSSSSPTAEQKDIAFGSLSTCGTIKIVKDAVPDSPQNFGFHASTSDTNPLSPGTFSLVDNGAPSNTQNVQEFDNLNPGTYHVTEDSISAVGWALSGISCDDPNKTPSSGDVPSKTATINVSNSEMVTCTFTNAFTKQPSTTTTSSSLQGSTVVPGTSVTDTATVAGIVGGPTPTGSVTFFLCQPATVTANGGDCHTGGTQVGASAVNLDATGHATSSASTDTTTAGTYCWRAVYGGDSFYNDSTEGTSLHECFTTVKQPSSTTTASSTQSSTVVPGTSVTDTATVTGSGATPTGSVTFFLCQPATVTANGGDCHSGGAQVGAAAVALDAGGHATSDASTNTTTVGTYCWRAVYGGDGFYNGSSELTSSHECFTTVKQPSSTKKSPTIATTLSASEVVAGSSVHDSATLTGATGNAGGTVAYTVYSNTGCTTGAQDAGTKNVTNGVVPDSNALAFNTAGDFYWQAVYSGDGNNNGASSVCTSEHLVVDKPAIAITKTPATQAVNSGGTATFTITVTNTGTVTLANVTVTDPLSTGCAKAIGTLTAGQSTSYTCSQSGVTAAFTNVATVTGHPPVGPDVTASASANVTVNPPPSSSPSPSPSPSPNPSIAITKNPKSQTITQGATATFTIVVTNTGDTTLNNVRVTDALAPGCARTLGTLAPGASTNFTCTLTNVQANLTNVAIALGTPESGGADVTATDSAPVTVTAPFVPPAVVTHSAISIVKDPSSQSVAFDGTATFTVTVKNTGDVTLTNVTVTDPLSPDCDRNLGTLAAGASKSYSCKRANVKDDFTNVATATGKPPTGANVKATDSATVKAAPFTPPSRPVTPPSRPAIAIVKTTSTPTVPSGNTATFKVTVTNTGNTELKNVTVTDPLSPGCDRSIGTLAAGASSSYSCTRPNLKNGFTNVATATGKPPTGPNVKATASVPVKVMQPKPQVVAHIKPKATG